MKKSTIALFAAAALATSAFAQTNVSVYGKLDAGYQYEDWSGATKAGSNVNSRNSLNANSSYIGFKGTEDLGNGLAAIFQIETFVNTNGTGNAYSTSTSGTTFSGQRDTFVGIKSATYGTAIAGYNSTPLRNAIMSYDPFGGIGIGATSLGQINTGANGVYVNNQSRATSVAYVTPTYAGFSGSVAYIPNANVTNESTDSKSADGYSAAANYTNGGFQTTVAYTKLSNGGVGTAVTPVKLNSEAETTFVGAKYTC